VQNKNGQHAVTQQRENARQGRLTEEFGLLQRDDPRRMAFYSVRDSPAARVLLTTWPDDFRFSKREWHELMHIYFGLPSPDLQPFVGSTYRTGAR
jgi:hypothetical protein